MPCPLYHIQFEMNSLLERAVSGFPFFVLAPIVYGNAELDRFVQYGIAYILVRRSCSDDVCLLSCRHQFIQHVVADFGRIDTGTRFTAANVEDIRIFFTHFPCCIQLDAGEAVFLFVVRAGDGELLVIMIAVTGNVYVPKVTIVSSMCISGMFQFYAAEQQDLGA